VGKRGDRADKRGTDLSHRGFLLSLDFGQLCHLVLACCWLLLQSARVSENSFFVLASSFPLPSSFPLISVIAASCVQMCRCTSAGARTFNEMCATSSKIREGQHKWNQKYKSGVW
jgi:hypothetical protein